MKRLTLIAVALLLALAPASAQKSKNKKKATAKKAAVVKKPVVVEPEEDPKVTKMLEATQRIVFIDSVVVDKKDFLSSYSLNSESGNILAYNDFFHSEDQPYSTVYQNQLGNKCYFSENGRLYTSDMLGSNWSEPVELEGIGAFRRTNYPFMMADGTTLYFSAIGPEGLGGLDIYVTRFDSSTGTFLKAENIGMPFNSEANDYMYVIDEIDSIGFFATDRRQPEGKVCIYSFIPNQSRRIYSPEDYEEAVIRSRAAIERISDTWGNGTARKQALARLKSLRSAKPSSSPKQSRDTFSFIIDDDIVYTSLSDFRNAENRNRLSEWQALKDRHRQLGETLEKARNYYPLSSSAERTSLRQEIVKNEQLFYSQQQAIRKLEQTIRNEELRIIQKQ